MSTTSVFTDEYNRRRACDDYAKYQQNILSTSSEKAMDELKENAEKAGWTFKMTNEQAYMQPNALVKPKYELVRLEPDRPTVMTVTVGSGIGADFVETSISDGDKILDEKRWNYGYNCSYKKEYANEKEPYIGDVLQSMIDTYHVSEFSVESGKNVFAGKEIGSDTVMEFREKHCSELKVCEGDVKSEEDDFTDAIEAISTEQNELQQ